MQGSDAANLIQRRARESAAVIEQIAEPPTRDAIARVAGIVTAALRSGGKLIVFGNGGSAADAQHIATELVGRYLRERRALPAISLAENTSSLTAIGNDYGFERVFARQVEALCRPGDAVLGISTSGESANVIAGIEAAARIGARTLGLTGAAGDTLAAACEECIRAPSTETPRIQEGHILIAHMICELVETDLDEPTEK